MEKTENTMEEASVNLQTVVGAAADPSSGEFDVPPNVDARAMKHALESVMVDERTLNTLYAWIRKSDENGLDGMVHILQRLLQLYAARELDENSSALDTVICSSVEERADVPLTSPRKVITRPPSPRICNVAWKYL